MSRHPFLALAPEARRRLARVLMEGVAESQADTRARLTRHGLLSAAACTVAGTGLGLGWVVLAGGAWAPFALGYAGWLGLQAAAGARLAARLPDGAPAALRWAALAPYEAASGLSALVRPPRVPAERLVLAGGILVAIRRPLSYHLLRRLYGRAYPQAEVARAVRLLLDLGLVATARGVLGPTPEGVALLKALGVPAPAPRPRREPQIASHLAPLFRRLEQRAPAHPMPEPVLAPAHPAPEPLLSPPTPEPVEPPRKPASPTTPLELPRRSWRVPAIAAATVLAVGLLAYWLAPRPGAPRPLTVSAAAMPHSRGTALQFNGRGLLLSSFAGGLFLSVPDRLDYKRPLSFRGYDMATDCGLLSQPLRQVSMSPHGRFLLAELGVAGGPRERCLIDTETKTVTHDLAARNPIYGLPHLVGWSGAQNLVLSEDPPGRGAERWWTIDVTTGEKRPVSLPGHGRVLPLPAEGGAMQALGLDMHRRGVWDLATYWLDDARELRPATRVRATFPEALKEAEPVTAALSPDKRYVLLTVRPLGAKTATPLVVELTSGRALAPHAEAAALPERPIFWGPEMRGGRYRFYFNGETPEGVSPWTGELTVGS